MRDDTARGVHRDEVATRLRAAGCLDAAGEAGDLVAAARDLATLEAMVRRREAGEPFEWILGSTDFCGHTVVVEHGVYPPRPHSERLAVLAGVELARCGAGARAADLCTGSGAVAVHLAAAAPSARVVGVDLSPVAAGCAHRNAVSVVVGDLGAPLATGAFDVVTAVAPYVPTAELRLLPADVQRFEPRDALDGGDDGLDVVRRVVRDAARLLRSGGSLYVELGGDQDLRLAPALADAGFGEERRWDDAEGDLRGLTARRR